MDNSHATSNPKAKASSENKKKPVSELVNSYVAQLAMALGVLIPTERSLLYIRALSDLTERQLAHGFEKALKYFKPDFGKTFPYPGELREWACEWRPATENTRLLLDRGDKPADWQPLTPGEIETMRREAAAKAETIQEQIRTAARDRSMPSGQSAAEFERIRQKQLREFREKNGLAGEA